MGMIGSANPQLAMMKALGRGAFGADVTMLPWVEPPGKMSPPQFLPLPDSKPADPNAALNGGGYNPNAMNLRMQGNPFAPQLPVDQVNMAMPTNPMIGQPPLDQTYIPKLGVGTGGAPPTLANWGTQGGPSFYANLFGA